MRFLPSRPAISAPTDRARASAFRRAGVVIGLAVLLAGLLTGCDLGRVPEADRPRPSPTPSPTYLDESALDQIYGSAERMVAATRAVTDARIAECREIGEARVSSWTRCWEDLLEPLSRTLRAFGTVASRVERGDVQERCDRALLRITTQATRGAESMDALLRQLGSDSVGDRSGAAARVADIVDDAAHDVGATNTRFERYCVDPEDQRGAADGT